jgi:hypothetical protein
VRNDVPLKDRAFSIDSLSAKVIYAALKRIHSKSLTDGAKRCQR